MSQPKLPTPVRSRSNSLLQKSNMESSSSSISISNNTSILPDFTFSFFENDSSELDNLSNTLGANLALSSTDKEHSESTPQYRIKRASEILQSSLRTSSLSKSSFEPTSATHNDELVETRSRLKEMEANYKVLQVCQWMHRLLQVTQTGHGRMQASKPWMNSRNSRAILNGNPTSKDSRNSPLCHWWRSRVVCCLERKSTSLLIWEWSSNAHARSWSTTATRLQLPSTRARLAGTQDTSALFAWCWSNMLHS